jgi:phenylacetate-CoA ligase
MEGRDLSLNRTRLRYNRASATTGFTTKKNDNWIGPLETIIRTGANKQIDYLRPNLGALCKELERDPIGYFVAQPRVYEMMLQHVEPEFFKRAGTAMIVPVAEALDPTLRAVFSSVCIPVRGSYSSEEVGLIGSECEKFGGHYHVATSNVIVEVIGEENIGTTGKPVGRILVTNLHSYATPFIRYDVGDVGTLEERCSCGHDGPVLSNVYGRTKALLQHADGRVTPFFPRGKELTAIARFDEYRIIQKTLTNIAVEIGGRESLSPEETAAFIALIKLHAGDEFDVQVKPVAEIDWGHSIKRLGFYCAI